MSAVPPAPPAASIKKSQAYLLKGGLSNQSGFLTLLPDRLAHVTSTSASVGMAFGIVGVLLAGRLGGRNIEARALAGGKGVTAVLLDDLRLIRKPRRNQMEVETKTGNRYKFSVPYDRWAPAIKLQLEARGARAIESESEMTIRS